MDLPSGSVRFFPRLPIPLQGENHLNDLSHEFPVSERPVRQTGTTLVAWIPIGLSLSFLEVRNSAVQTASEKNRTRSQCEGTLFQVSARGCLSLSMGQPIGLKRVGRSAPTARLLSGIVASSFQDLMDTLTAYAEPLRYSLKSPTLLPQPGDGYLLSGIDLRVRMGMFEEELSPINSVTSTLAISGAAVILRGAYRRSWMSSGLTPHISSLPSSLRQRTFPPWSPPGRRRRISYLAQRIALW